MSEERSDTILRVLRFAAVGIGVVAAAALALSLILGDDNEDEPVAQTSPKQITRLSPAVQSDAIEAAISDPTVRQVVKVRAVDDTSAAPWVAEGGTELQGSYVRLKLKKPLRLDSVKFPVYITPSRDAPASTPSLRRFALFSGTGVTELAILMRLPSHEVLEIAPEGPRAVLSAPKLIGPPVSDDYRESGGY